MPVAGDGLQLVGTLSACSGSIRVIALMRVLLCTILLLVSHGAVSKDAFLIGPWDIGDTRQSVVAATRLGPFEPVVATGGLETRRAVFLGRRTTVSFVFDATDRVEYLQVWLYEGRSYRKARKEALRILDLFEAELGGATIPGIVHELGAGVAKNLPAAYAWYRCAAASAQWKLKQKDDPTERAILKDVDESLRSLAPSLTKQDIASGDVLAARCIERYGRPFRAAP
jgi:hypothetical protein